MAQALPAPHEARQLQLEYAQCNATSTLSNLHRICRFACKLPMTMSGEDGLHQLHELIAH